MSRPYDPKFAPATAERIARNNAIFRDANERIREAAEEHAAGDRPVPFICECADPSCTELVRMTLAQYRWIRADPTRFLNAAGHQVAAQGHAAVVASQDGHIAVEKLGEAGAIAAELVEGSGELAPPRGDE